jgi:daunorubicin resistance ABC transporter ATP-binding subunit
VQAKVQRDQDVLFGGEVVIDRGLGEAERRGDLAQRGLVVALLDEQVQGDVEDPLAGVTFVGVPAGAGQGPPAVAAERRAMPVEAPVTSLMIEAEGLTKRYGPTVALAGIDLQVPAGSILGVLGPNGAGKTTALRILTTLSRPDAGWARVAGHDVVREGAAVQRNIGVTAQDATVDEVLTGRQNLVMIGRLSGLRRRQARARAAELLDQFDLADAADRMLREYSGGMRRRLDLAAGLVTRPPVLFLDEPTTGLDPASRLRMWNVIRELVAGGVTLMLTTQYLDEADELADRIVVIDHGHVIAEGTAADLKTQTGGARLEVTLTEANPAASGALEPYVAGPVQLSQDGRRLRAPVRSGGGLASTVVRALDAAGITVDDVEVHQPSLDDVFFALTGRPAEMPAETTGDRDETDLEAARS